MGLIDAATRLVWAEILPDIKALTAMFAALNMFAGEYQVKFGELLSDNGPEFGPKNSATKLEPPF